MHASNFIDMTGWVMAEHGVPNSRLTVIGLDQIKNGVAMWKCTCSCEGHNEVIVRGSNLKNGNTLSCGCLFLENLKQRQLVHGDSERGKQSRLYKIWADMKQRCLNPNNTAYKNYGGRGIKVYDKWIESYEVFKKWALENGYTDSLTIERINVNGDYEPLNCTWVTMKEQQNNRRNNRIITYNGETHTLAQWAEKTGISKRILWERIFVKKMDIKDVFAIDIPFSTKKIEYNGKICSLSELAQRVGIKEKLLYNRIYQRGWSVEKALSTPVRPQEKIIEFNGEKHNIKEWSQITGIRAGTIARRLRQNWSLDKVFSK